MVETCKNCIQWIAGESVEKYPDGLPICGTCAHPSNVGDYASPPSRDGASDVDRGELTTGPDFGCIHFGPT